MVRHPPDEVARLASAPARDWSATIRRIALVVPCVVIGSIVAFLTLDGCANHTNLMNRVPDELHATGVAFDMGGGDNAFGIGFEYALTIYDMDTAEADRVAKGGLPYLNAIAISRAARAPDHRIGTGFEVWHKTPARYMEPGTDPPQPGQHVIDAQSYMRYAEGIPANVPRMAQDILSSQDGYYSEGKTGYLIVAPKLRKIVFVFAQR